MKMLKLMVVSIFGMLVLAACGSGSSGGAASNTTQSSSSASVEGVTTAAQISVVTAE